MTVPNSVLGPCDRCGKDVRLTFDAAGQLELVDHEGCDRPTLWMMCMTPKRLGRIESLERDPRIVE